MSEKVLFGAEVNKIQQTLFGASRQRQVVGGSDLLKRFSEQAGKKALSEFGAEKIIVSAGGKFYILFGNKTDAGHFGRFLSDSYHFLLDGSMTVAHPLNIPSPIDDHFAEVKNKLDEELNTRKHRQAQGHDTAHAPTTAFCGASGYGLATHYERLSEDLDDTNYISEAAWTMHQAGRDTKRNEAGSFLNDIHQHLPAKYKPCTFAETPEELSVWDPSKNNVAYIVADANNMGKYFGHCRTPDELHNLSKAVDEAVKKAIAMPLVNLYERLWESDCLGNKPENKYLPMLPLIAAGDDIFLLLPAPYALDYARHFCLAFEQELSRIDLVDQLQDRLPPPRMSVAVVICKESYPYHLAHQFGEQLLKEAKQMGKRTGRETGEWYSAVSFGAIIGSEIALSKTEKKGLYKIGRPAYWALEYPSDQPAPLQEARNYSTALQSLLIQRVILQRLPAKRLNEVRTLFDAGRLPTDGSNLPEWEADFNDLRKRIAETGSPGSLGILDHTLMELGDPDADPDEKPGLWQKVRHQNYSVQGLTDLLSVWNYAQLLNKPLCDYLQEHEDDN